MRTLARAVLLAALLAARPAAAAAAEPLEIGLAARLSPAATVTYYGPLLAWLGDRLGRRVEMVQLHTYEEMNAALERREFDVAFVSTGAYVTSHERFGVELLAAPTSGGRPFHYASFVVPAASPARTLADLRGKRFAFTDPLSVAGHLVPAYTVAREAGVPAERFFGTVRYTFSHDASIAAVAAGDVDGASVESTILDYVSATSPRTAGRVRVLARSAPIGLPPVVVNRALDPALKARLRALLLGMHRDPKGRAILAAIRVDRFVVPSDADYGAVREMERWLRAQPRR